METQRDQTQPCALPLTQRTDLMEHHYTTAERLSDQGNITAAQQLPNSLSTAGSKSQGTGYDGTLVELLLHREKPSKQLLRWPSSPKPITTPAYIKVLYVIFDVLLLSFSAAFLAFAVIVSVHDQDSTAEYPRLTRTLLNATKYGPTVFPILFASVIGRATHAILLWRLEHGERIGVLDTLATSTSLTSTVTSQLQLRSLSTLGVGLLAVWLLSPIGGQASVRIMTIGSKDNQINESLWYMVNNGYLGGYTPFDMQTQGRSSAGVVFVAALMGSPATKSSPLDLWGNVKIPRIEGYEGVAPMNDDSWYDTKHDNVDTYSSLIGIPVAGINDSKFIDHVTRIQSPYLSLQCSLNTMGTERVGSDGKAPSGLYANVSSAGSMICWEVPNIYNSSQLRRDRLLPETASPLRISYVPLYRSNFTLVCNVTQSYIETEIRCPTPSTCAASRVRRSKLSHFPPAWTLLDLSWRTLPHLFQGMLENFDNGKLNNPQLIDRYLSDPNLISSNYANVTRTTEEKYTIRLGQMLNAYFACLNGFFAITAGINNETAYFGDNNHTFTLQPETPGNSLWETQYHSTAVDGNLFKTKAWSTEATKTERKEVIVAHRGWVVALCFASILLIVSSLVAPFVHHFLTIGVDVAMNISSLATRSNPHMALPNTGTYLDASDRARLLRNHQIRFGDVEGAADVGTLVMGSLDGASIARVRKGRLYE